MGNSIVLDLDIAESGYGFSSSIASAEQAALLEIQTLNETIESVQAVKPDCDKLDYALAACSGALCGMIDIFLVGKPGESVLGKITDNWVYDRVVDFAKLCGWKEGNKKSPTAFLEEKFKVPYDQSVGSAAQEVFGITPMNHRFKSLAHNPSILGLFFSILDQFTNTSHFVSDGEIMVHSNPDGSYELTGKSIPAKLFCAFVNWFGHLMSDAATPSNTGGRGMGIPSPLWTWTNDIIAIKRELNLPVFQFETDMQNLAVKIYTKGFDARFQLAQAIPVFINELIVRLLYTIRRLLRYLSDTKGSERSFIDLWTHCEPFSNATVKRMLTVAHGTFCLLDVGDAAARGILTGAGSFNVVEFFLRLNVAGVQRFTISLYGEAKRAVIVRRMEEEADFARREKIIVENYINGLHILADAYDDRNLVNFADDFKSSELYIRAFEKSVQLAEKRNVPDDKILRDKSDIDDYFLGGRD